MKIKTIIFKIIHRNIDASINIEDEYLHYKNEKMEMNVNLIKKYC